MDNFNREISILDDSGAEIGRVNRVKFIFEHASPFGIKQPEIVNGTVKAAEVARYVNETSEKLEAICRPIAEWAAAGVEAITRAFKPLAEYIEANQHFTGRGPHITRYRPAPGRRHSK